MFDLRINERIDSEIIYYILFHANCIPDYLKETVFKSELDSKIYVLLNISGDENFTDITINWTQQNTIAEALNDNSTYTFNIKDLISSEDKNWDNIYLSKSNKMLAESVFRDLKSSLERNQDFIFFNTKSNFFHKLRSTFSESKYISKNLIFYADDYIPKRYYDYKNLDKKRINYSIKLLNIKDLKVDDLKDAAKYLNNILGKNFMICVVPSSDPAKGNGGIGKVIEKLIKIKNSNIEYDHNILTRIKKIPKRTNQGSNRSANIHEKSINIVGNVSDKNILLIDDITTSGNSLFACKQKLLQANAKLVILFALGRTIPRIENRDVNEI